MKRQTNVNQYELSPKYCVQCRTIISYDKKANNFCNKNCSATYNNQFRSDDSRQKQIATLRNTLKTKIKQPTIYKISPGPHPSFGNVITVRPCIECFEYFATPNKVSRCQHCSFSMGGRNSASKQSKSRRSKNEIYFSELCAEKYKVITNERIFNGWDADVILTDLKIAVLWNGIWHREKITKKHSVEQVKNRDKIKIKEIIKCGYTPYIIDDNSKFNKLFVEAQFILFQEFLNIQNKISEIV